MYFARIIYCVVVIMLGVASLSATALCREVGLPLLIILQSAISLMTFPTGAIASLVNAGLVFSGWATLLEAIVLTTPLFTALGYLQWFWLFPKIYAGNERLPVSDPGPAKLAKGDHA